MHPTRRHLTAVAAALVVALAGGCASDEPVVSISPVEPSGAEDADRAEPDDGSSLTIPPMAPSSDGDDGQAERETGDERDGELHLDVWTYLDQATEDARAHAAAQHPDAAVGVVEAVAGDWPDGSIGCPGDGMGYTSALVPGYLIVLDVDGEQVRYHGADGEQPFPCPTERAQGIYAGEGRR